MMRIAQAIARSGICSRRQAEELIFSKKVKVNGEVIDHPSLKVSNDDKIIVNNKPLPQSEQTKLFILHKPKGVLVSRSDDQNRKTLKDILPSSFSHVMPVGRLDYNTEGLLLFTNNGRLSRYLELPSTGWTRKYRVRVFGEPSQKMIDELAAGCKVEGYNYAPIKLSIDKRTGSNFWLTMALTEGKNREIRKILEFYGHPVSRLIRISYGPFQLGQLPLGKIKAVPNHVLKNSLGEQYENYCG